MEKQEKEKNNAWEYWVSREEIHTLKETTQGYESTKAKIQAYFDEANTQIVYSTNQEFEKDNALSFP